MTITFDLKIWYKIYLKALYVKYATDRAIRRKNIDLENIFMWPYMTLTLTLDLETLFQITALPLTKGTLLVMYKHIRPQGWNIYDLHKDFKHNSAMALTLDLDLQT